MHLLSIIRFLADSIMALHFWGLFGDPFLASILSCFVTIFDYQHVMVINVVSSAYLMSTVMFSHLIVNELSSDFTSLFTKSWKILNRVGDGTHSCLTPISTLNHLVMLPFIVTEHYV